MSHNRFNWRPMSTAPTDGADVVTLRVVTRVGGWHRPIDIAPEIYRLTRRHVDPTRPGSGVWYLYDRSAHSHDRDWWTSPQEYASAVPSCEWTEAPDDLFGIGPLVFVRPTEPRLSYDGHKTPWIYDADIVWNGSHHGAAGWSCSKRIGPDSYLHRGYLDGVNVNGLPFRWCTLADFLPPDAFDRLATAADNRHRGALDSITAWRSR